MTYILWTTERKASLEQAALAGEDALTALTLELGCEMVTLRKAIVRYGFKRPKETHKSWGGGKQRKHERWTPEVEDLMREAAKGPPGSIPALATRLGIPLNIFCRHAKRIGAQPTKGQEIVQTRIERNDGVRTCSRCKITLPLDEFHMHSTRELPSGKLCKRCTKIQRYDSVKDTLRKTTAYKKGRIPLDILVEMYARQGGKCYYTDVFMDFRQKNTAPSVDRIDSSRPYEPGNMVMCCFRVNIMKNVCGLEHFILFANMVAKKHPRVIPEGVSINPFEQDNVM